MKRVLTALILAIAAPPAVAESYVPISDEDTFRSLINGKQLNQGFFGITLTLLETGQIKGRAIGRDVTGNWDWQDGYFCRDLIWGDDPLGYNCQLVELKEDGKIRFTSDRGVGDAAAFQMR